jgi:mannose-6-phosphate isomerase-like protein (cupin superfamily)
LLVTLFTDTFARAGAELQLVFQTTRPEGGRFLKAVGPRYDDAVEYNTRLDNKYGSLNVIDIAAEARDNEPWFNQTLTQVNDAVVRIGVIKGEYHWHKHDVEDECFIVLEGELLLDIEGKGTVVLTKHLGYTVPHGVVHRTRALVRTVILMVEPATVTPTGDA